MIKANKQNIINNNNRDNNNVGSRRDKEKRIVAHTLSLAEISVSAAAVPPTAVASSGSGSDVCLASLITI